MNNSFILILDGLRALKYSPEPKILYSALGRCLLRLIGETAINMGWSVYLINPGSISHFPSVIFGVNLINVIIFPELEMLSCKSFSELNWLTKYFVNVFRSYYPT